MCQAESDPNRRQQRSATLMRLLVLPQAKHLCGTIASKNPRAHTANVRKEFRILIDHLRGDIGKFDDPKAQALFETAAEVISGLDTAFEHYEEKSESAWK